MSNKQLELEKPDKIIHHYFKVDRYLLDDVLLPGLFLIQYPLTILTCVSICVVEKEENVFPFHLVVTLSIKRAAKAIIASMHNGIMGGQSANLGSATPLKLLQGL